MMKRVWQRNQLDQSKNSRLVTVKIMQAKSEIDICHLKLKASRLHCVCCLGGTDNVDD